ncbi:chymotrypsinogen B-like [Apostichopus japonicus]|uniref:chymotrypsinogen B-like n=1 Tax=Stichopus japonicus TaxID=307972 RepID=UPI003AB529CA
MFLIFVVISLCLGGGRRISALPLESTNGDMISSTITTEPLVEASGDVMAENVNQEDDWSTTEVQRARFLSPRIASLRAPAPLSLQESSAPMGLLPSSLTENDVKSVFQCGVRPKDEMVARGRIVGGLSTKTRWPWMVQILRKEDRELICGATLLSDRHVITAGHCIRGQDGEYGPSDLIVRIGDHYLNEIEAHEQDINIECMFMHPNYDASTLKNDIAVIKLKVDERNPIKFTSDLLPACLPNKREFKAGTECYITGWGYRDFIDYYYDLASPSLTEAKVPLLSSRECKNLGRVYGTDVTKKMQCAGYLTGESRADTCKKDSGGPLVCQSKDGSWKLWGITSWGDNTFCESSPTLPSPGVYTRVDKYLSWINIKLGETCPK